MMHLRALWGRMIRWLLVVTAVVAPAVLLRSANAATPTLLLAPDHGHYRGDCAQTSDSVVMAMGRDFPEGAGVALYAMRTEGASLRLENIQTLLATVIIKDGRFVAGNVGLRSLLCWMRDRYPDGTRIEIVAATGTSFDDARPRHGTALARAVFTVDSTAPVPATQRCFSETLLCVQNRFHDYWLATGGLARHGHPLMGERAEQLEDGKTYTVQYFERSRLESHPENQWPDDIQLGQFGRRIRPADPPVPPLPGARYFAETGHNLRGRFLAYWQVNGGLPQFGYPISEEFEEQLEDGQEYTVQYFERARMEYHPENPAPYDVLLGQFGRRILAER